MINPRKNPVFLLLLLAAVAGAGIARWCMSSGVGVSPDSVIYLSAADSLIAGDGLKPIAFHYSPKVAGGEPLISFPPVYPLLLSLSSIINSDRLSGARWLHSLLFAANIFLVGLLVYLGTARSALATLVGILLLVSSASMLEIHTMAWSEPPFVLFILLAALLLMLHTCDTALPAFGWRLIVGKFGTHDSLCGGNNSSANANHHSSSRE